MNRQMPEEVFMTKKCGKQGVFINFNKRRLK